MHRFAIEKRITVLVMQAVMLTLLLAISSVLILQNISDRELLNREIDNLVSVVNRSIAPALAFGDDREVQATLEAFGQDPKIISALVSDQAGAERAQYRTNKQYRQKNSRSNARKKFLSVRKAIYLQGEKLGEIAMAIDDVGYQYRQKKLIVSLGLIGFLCATVGLYLSKRLPKALITSIGQLEDTFKQLSRSDSYTSRAKQTQILELDSLVDSFNVMIDRAAQREREINAHKENLEMALEGSGEGLWSFAVKEQQWYLDERAKEITGFSSLSDVRDFLRSLAGHDQKKVLAILSESKHSKDKKFEFECAILDPDGKENWVMVHGKLYCDEFAELSRISGTVLDIDAAKKAQRESELLAAVFQNTREPVFVIDESLKLLSKNKAFSDYFDGYNGYASVDKLDAFSPIKNPHQVYQEIKDGVHKADHWEGQVEIRLIGEEYESKWLTVSKIQEANNSNASKRYLGTFVALDQRKTIEDKLRYYANYDALTDLPNRRYFLERLKRAFAAAQKNHSLMCLFFLDMNDFKLINDRFGHRAGDELLIIVANRLQSHFSGGRYIVARLGGDEFVILCEDLDSLSEVSSIAESILTAAEGPHVVIGHEVPASISVGAACFPGDAVSPEDLMRNADIAMYEAKLRGRNQYLLFNSKMSEQVANYSELKNDLAFAIQRNELSIYLQPKFDLKTLEIRSAEALLRWHHPERGFVSPAEFIPIAEDSGIISELGVWVMEQAIKQLNQWAMTEFQNFDLSVNVSAKQFSDVQLTDQIAYLLTEHSVSAARLDIEITESLLASSRSVADKFCAAIKQIGSSLSIDDFGTGYSSFRYLAELPLDTLKIDRDFIRRIESKEQDQTIINAMINIANSLDMQVVAEGIETEAQMEYLRQKGCEYGQGYWCSPPLPVEEFEAFCLRWNREVKIQQSDQREAG